MGALKKPRFVAPLIDHIHHTVLINQSNCFISYHFEVYQKSTTSAREKMLHFRVNNFIFSFNFALKVLFVDFLRYFGFRS